MLNVFNILLSKKYSILFTLSVKIWILCKIQLLWLIESHKNRKFRHNFAFHWGNFNSFTLLNNEKRQFVIKKSMKYGGSCFRRNATQAYNFFFLWMDPLWLKFLKVIVCELRALFCIIRLCLWLFPSDDTLCTCISKEACMQALLFLWFERFLFCCAVLSVYSGFAIISSGC